MVYLDYSATTPIDPEVANVWMDVEQRYFANANSSHALGVQSMQRNQESLALIAKLFGIQPSEFILTSSAVESNNFAIKGLALKHPNKKHIISSKLEHASMVATLASLGDAYEIDWIELEADGTYNLSSLVQLFKPTTLCVTLVAVDSETGIRQPVEEVGELCHQHGILFHCDATQAIGKTRLDVSHMDLVSLSAHKFYGPKGAGGLIKKENVALVPLLHGGHSLTPYRASTPATALLAAFAKALELSFEHFDERQRKVADANAYLKAQCVDLPRVIFNSNTHSIPHILNLSILGSVPEEGLQYFSDHGLYLSSKSACSGQEEFSMSVYAITRDQARATSSYRISLSHLTTLKDLDQFVSCLKGYLGL